MTRHLVCFALLSLLAFSLCALPLAAQPEVVNPVPPVPPPHFNAPAIGLPGFPAGGVNPAPFIPPQPQHVIRHILILHRPELLTDFNNHQSPLWKLREFFPEGIQSVQPSPFANALLIRATNEEAIDQFEHLLKLIDQPKRQIILRLTLITIARIEADAFAEEAAQLFAAPKDDNRNPLKKTLAQLLKDGDTDVVSTAVVLLGEGDEANINFANSDFAPLKFAINTAGHPDNSLTLSVRLHPDALPTGVWSSSIRLQPDTTVILASGLIPDKAKNPDDDSLGMIFVTPMYAKGL